ncbi:ATP-binding cassette domain-containing protein [Motiliproteus coralliicola]|uniref:ATP-binding cassette domain-containing protein n=1 Tax=Motiliproteus coralliicola TaxID=2283196 RepID=A0A369WBH6_9GAMM|nr:ATP-binding cassette domain-containing protein [Motiliproteus coralliicola]RDE18064.1 ATP-binding cassette domain-containing protein [Motiliproteus coralliicola]
MPDSSSLTSTTHASAEQASVEPIIAVEQLSHRVDARQGELIILSGLDLQVNRGESVAILGASGSGKSTLLGLLAGLDRASSGSIRLAGQRLEQLDEDQRATLRSEQVGFVFQNFQLLPALTALENVMLPLELAGHGQAAAEAKALLERVGLGSRLDHTPLQLSGGEQQRVAIARAFASNPQILFADEPTGNLDRQTGETVIELLFALNREQQTTLILVTHDIHLAERCQRQLELIDGRLVEQNATAGADR